MWNDSPTPEPQATVTRLGAGNPELAAMVAAAHGGGTPLMLMHLDIHHFASINENMSAEVGDEALVLVAERLRENIPAQGRLWRHGSDEFILVIPRAPGVAAPEDMAEQLRQQMELPLSVLPYTLFLTAKIGVALCPEHGSDPSRLLDLAEDALHQARREGGNIVQMHALHRPLNAHSESIIARQLVDAIDNGELRLRYQPLARSPLVSRPDAPERSR